MWRAAAGVWRVIVTGGREGDKQQVRQMMLFNGDCKKTERKMDG